MTSQFAHPGICTVTFFSGEVSAVEEHIRARLRLIIDQNPWLGGKLEKTGKLVRLVHRAAGSEVQVNDIIEVRTSPVPNLSEKTPYAALVDLCVPLQVGKGKALVKEESPVTKVLLAPLEEAAGGGFALVFSMSHVIADGYTYYEVLITLITLITPIILMTRTALTTLIILRS